MYDGIIYRIIIIIGFAGNVIGEQLDGPLWTMYMQSSKSSPVASYRLVNWMEQRANEIGKTYEQIDISVNIKEKFHHKNNLSST